MVLSARDGPPCRYSGSEEEIPGEQRDGTHQEQAIQEHSQPDQPALCVRRGGGQKHKKPGKTRGPAAAGRDGTSGGPGRNGRTRAGSPVRQEGPPDGEAEQDRAEQPPGEGFWPMGVTKPPTERHQPEQLQPGQDSEEPIIDHANPGRLEQMDRQLEASHQANGQKGAQQQGVTPEPLHELRACGKKHLGFLWHSRWWGAELHGVRLPSLGGRQVLL